MKRLCQQDSRNGEWLITIEEPFDWLVALNIVLLVSSEFATGFRTSLVHC